MMSPDGGTEDGGRIDELTQQLTAQAGMITELADHVRALERKSALIEAELREQRETNRALLTDGVRKSDKSELRSVKKLYPDKWEPSKESFKEWASEFLKWIKAEDEELEEYLRLHQFDKEPLPLPSGSRAGDVRFVHSHLKKLVTDKESKRLIKSTPKDHGGEAFRRLMKKHNPQTQAVKSRRLREVGNFGLRHAGTAQSEVIAILAEYEELIDKYVEDYSEEPILEEQKRDALKLMLPREIERAFNLNNLGRKEEFKTYEELKDAVEEFIVEFDSYSRPARRAPVGSTEEVYGLNDKGGKAKGKGAGSGALTVPGGSAQQPPGSCSLCWKFGHFRRDCEWNPANIALKEGKGSANSPEAT